MCECVSVRESVSVCECMCECVCKCVCVCAEWIRLAHKGQQNQFLVNADNQPEAGTKSVECFRDLSKYSLLKRDYAACS